MTRSTLAGALAGASTLALAYAALRRSGVTRADLAETLAPGRPAIGRAAQLVVGTAACLPAALLAGPRRGLVAGLAAGGGAAATQRGRVDRVLALATHAVAGVVAARVSRAAARRRAGG
ncbi:MAG TPA: hypothetical protein VGF46_00545 [Gaiellales bacterium]